MKTLDFFYQETQIHFSLQNEGNVMVNATEMAKLFNKRLDHFLKADHTKAFMKALEFTPNGVNSDNEQTPNGGRSENKLPDISGSLDKTIIDSRGHMGTYFERRLALKFAAWLSPKFEVWVFSTLDNILFGNYKKHWEAHQEQLKAQDDKDLLKLQLLSDPTPQIAMQYFEAEAKIKACKNKKQKAIKDQYKLEL